MVEAHKTLDIAEMSASSAQQTSLTQVILAWAVVSIPLLWGVLQTLEKALALFQ